jgi:hypothetical protein
MGLGGRSVRNRAWPTDHQPNDSINHLRVNSASLPSVKPWLKPRRPIGKSERVPIVRRAPPTAPPSLVSRHRRRAKPSPSFFRSTEGRRSPESCSSFRSSEKPHVGFTTVVLGCLTSASLEPVGSLRVLATARVGVVGPTRAESWLPPQRLDVIQQSSAAAGSA